MVKRLCWGNLLLWLANGACGGDGRGGNVDAADANRDLPVETTPGSSLAMVIEQVNVVDRQVQVDFRLLDGSGTPINRAGFVINWTLASLLTDAGGETNYASAIRNDAGGSLGTTAQPTSESNGRYQALQSGPSRYVFATAFPADGDANRTWRVAAWAQATPDGSAPLVANASFDFVPSQKSAPQDMDAVATVACNQCHDPLAAHGGFRREVPLCLTCHSQSLFDPDTQDPARPGQMNPLHLAVLVHRIHQGRDLPTIVAAQQARIVGAKYDVVGFRNSDNIYAQTVDASAPDASTEIRGVGFPQDIRNCTTCHQQAPGAGKWVTTVSRSLCGSCHDATWFDTTPAPVLHHAHPGGPMADDRACATCHPPTGGEFDLTVAGAHTVPSQSRQLRGLRLEIVSVQARAGGNPSVVFRVTNADGSLVQPLSSLDVLAATVAGPTPDYPQQNQIRQDVRARAQAQADGTYVFQFAPRAAGDAFFPGGPVIPTNARGTFAVGLEGRRAVTLASNTNFEEADGNPVAYVSVDGSTVQPYANLIELARCDRCHKELRAHGNLRRNVEYCVLCHSADATDWGQRPKVGGNVNLAGTVDHIEERSIRFAVLIHRIHTGQALNVTVPMVVYGFGGSVNRTDDVRFPGNRAHCTSCHLPDQFTIEAIASPLPTVANETAVILHRRTAAHVPQEPHIPVIQSTCLACHDTDAAHAHAELETTPQGKESCLVCHGQGRHADVRMVHLAD
jgi:OmcA/MtrC family decaheme c-type cytochrome